MRHFIGWRLAVCLVICASLAGCGGVSGTTINAVESVPPGFPRQILSFTGPTVAFGLDGKDWDAYGLGGPSNVLFVNGNYWMCVSGYPSAGFTAQTVGCFYGPSPTSMKPYAGNPVLTNTSPAWAADCIEGPDLNTDGKNIYMSFLGFSSRCDGMGPGSIGIVSTTVANFPEGFSAMGSVANIPKPPSLNWLYRPFIVEINGICYDYSNAGDTHGSPVIVSFKTTGTCAATEMAAGAWTFNRIEVSISQSWEGTSEIQDPQVFQVPSGLWIMIYGGNDTFKAGYATTTDPVNGFWSKLDTNPIHSDGQLWLPRLMQDAAGQYWMFGNFVNTGQMNLWKASGSAN